MASITSIFFTPDDASIDCCKAIEAVLGCSFHLETDEEFRRYRSHCIGIEFVLFNDHGMVNDLGIPFESYSYELDLSVDRKGVDSTLADSYQDNASRYIFKLMNDHLKWKMALVHNFQNLLATSPS